MLKKGGDPDLERAANWFVRWWREGGTLNPDLPLHTNGWGLDFDFGAERKLNVGEIESKMNETVMDFIATAKSAEGTISATQKKKLEKEERARERLAKRKKLLAAGSQRVSS